MQIHLLINDENAEMLGDLLESFGPLRELLLDTDAFVEDVDWDRLPNSAAALLEHLHEIMELVVEQTDLANAILKTGQPLEDLEDSDLLAWWANISEIGEC